MGDGLGLVIPTLNEEANIGALLDRVRANLNCLQVVYELLVVDDDSTDGAGEVVRKYSSSDPRIRLLVRRGCRGLAGAVIYGWDRTDANLLGVIDADLQHPLYNFGTFGLRHAGKSKANLRVGLDYLQVLGRLSRSAFSRSVGPS